MREERHDRVERVFKAALEKDPAERAAYLEGIADSDPELRKGVESLLVARSEHNFLERTPSAADSVSNRTAEKLTAIRPPSEIDNPSRIGPYHILREIGEGGMGIVYEAEQEKPVHRKVALKLIKWGMDTKAVVARFESERQALALMNHPNIASVHDGGSTEAGRPYFAMELVLGEPITAYCDKHRLTVKERLDLVIEVCDGVQHAHQKGVIHRDIKPSNILVTILDDKPVPKIIDFGVAKAISQRLTEKTVYTELGQWVGTPEYMSPEQAEMTGLDIDTRTDVYSLGAVLYELLAGAQPFDAATLRQAGFDSIRRILREEEPQKPSTKVHSLGRISTVSAKNRRVELPTLERELRGDLDWITMKALDKDRTRRYGSPSDLAEDIRRHLRNEPVVASPPSRAYRLRKFVRRHRGALLASGLVLLALVGGIVGTTIGLLRARTQAAIAEAVNQFLNEDLLAAVSPEEQGRDVLMREVLDAAAARIDGESAPGGRFARQPLVEAAVRSTLGETYYHLGLDDQALSHLERALSLHRSILGEREEQTLRSMVLLAMVERRRGETERAIELLEHVVATSVRVFGPDHARTMEAKNNLVSAYYDVGRIEEGIALLEPVLANRGATLGSDDPNRLSTINNLAALYSQQGRYDDALPLYREVLDTRRRALGEDDPRTLLSLNNLAALYKRRGELSRAEPLYVEGLERRRQVLGPEHPYTLLAMHNLGSLYIEKGSPDEAATLLTEALEAYRRIRGVDNRQTLLTQANLARAYKERGDLIEAEALTADALAKASATLPAGDWLLGTLSGHHGDSLARLGRFAEAEKLLLHGYDVLLASVGANDVHADDLVNQLVGLYERWQRADQAAEWRARLKRPRAATRDRDVGGGPPLAKVGGGGRIRTAE